jgi:flagellar biosynthesis chaperone FliJ
MATRSETLKTSEFQKALETVEALPIEAQEVLIDVLEKRINQQKRARLVQEVHEAEQDYAEGQIRRGSVADLMSELED